MRGHLTARNGCARDAGRHAVWRRAAPASRDAGPGPRGRARRDDRRSRAGLLALRTVRELDGLNVPSPLARPRRDAPTARLDSIVGTSAGLAARGFVDFRCGRVSLFAARRFRRRPRPSRTAASFRRRPREGAVPRGRDSPFLTARLLAAASASGAEPRRRAPRPDGTARGGPAGARTARSGTGATPARPPRRARRARPDARPRRSAGSPRVLRRRLLRPRRGGDPRRPRPRAAIRTTIFLTGEFIRRYPDLDAPHRRRRPRGRQPHRHPPSPDDVRRRRPPGHAPRRRSRVPRRGARAHGAALPRGDGPHHGPPLARPVRRAQRRDPALGRRGRVLARRAGPADARVSTASTGSAIRAPAPTSRPTGSSRGWSRTPRTAASSCCTSAATGRSPWRPASACSSTG